MREFEAKAFGMPSLPFVTVVHPYGQLPREEALQIARRTGEEVAQLLLELGRVPARVRT